MARMHRWLVVGAAVVLLGGSGGLLHAQDDRGFGFISSEQLVQILDERGRIRLWRFQANVRKYDDTGRITGGMVLERANERFEFRPTQMDALVSGDRIYQVVLEGRGLKTSGNQSADFAWTATVTPDAAAGGDILIYDIKDGFVYEKPPFEAEGSIAPF